MRAKAQFPYDALPEVPAFEVVSDDVRAGDAMAMVHVHPGLGGENRSPHLRWSGFPAETAGFAVTCLDPDAPTGSGFWHWSVVGIPAGVTELPAGGPLPEGAFCVRNDYGERDYGGPFPPAGDEPHRYIFAVHALKAPLTDVDADATPAVVGFNLTFATIARGFLVPVFGQ
ncbi:YbhB/YbcL family Raf kinase inhibitor-like protein [Hamadaea tsunoensis]|uniref:YbhB/YbcL family Raf kinase inhibitor-like protein n=1 Tax=Hamadaea tsunoensis TaxID=53368 RepID=UPI000409EFE2|nr:YbhB/YbcL family Raf kinase inhibitor-like protein [Hamadaea tsunoensis]